MHVCVLWSVFMSKFIAYHLCVTCQKVAWSCSTLSACHLCVKRWHRLATYSFYLNAKWLDSKVTPHKITCQLKKKYFTINFLPLIHKAFQIVSAFTSHCHCLLQSVTFISLTLTPNNPILFTAIPQHIIISPNHCIGYTALLKTLHNHFWWDMLPCRCGPHWLNTTCILLGL